MLLLSWCSHASWVLDLKSFISMTGGPWSPCDCRGYKRDYVTLLAPSIIKAEFGLDLDLTTVHSVSCLCSLMRSRLCRACMTHGGLCAPSYIHSKDVYRGLHCRHTAKEEEWRYPVAYDAGEIFYARHIWSFIRYKCESYQNIPTRSGRG